MDLLESELVSYCRQRLAAYKCPRVFQFRSGLPKNTLGKVLKDELVPGRDRASHAVLDVDVLVQGIRRGLAEPGSQPRQD
jgi:hypothetical protein